MVASRTMTAAAGLFVSVLVSVLLWWYFNSFVFFLFVPFVPFLFRRGGSDERTRAVRRCPSCGFETVEESFEYCPRDGRRLAVSGSENHR